MKNESRSLGFACALGAFVGALSALEIQSYFAYGSYFWSVGALFGGFVAYLAVDFRQFCTGVTRSARMSGRNIADAYRTTIAWRPYLPYWKATAMMTLACGTTATSFALFLYAGNYYVEHFTNFNAISTPGAVLFLLAFIDCVAIFVMAIPTIFAASINSKSTWRQRSNRSETYEEWLLSGMPEGRKLLKFGNPIVLPFVLLRLLALVIRDVTTYLWQNRVRGMKAAISIAHFIVEVGREAKLFAVRAFVYIHSERRTICFVDATLGAAAGFFFGSAFIGAMVGAVLGIVNYELVSVRWLKLVSAPAKAK